MKAILLNEPVGISGLSLQQVPEPEMKPDEILVRIRAVSLNYRDLVILDGAYRKQQKQKNLIPASDAAGEVVDVGADVSGFKVGERVVPLFFSEWMSGSPDQMTIKSDWGRDRDGMLCEFKTFKPHQVTKIPSSLSDPEAAALPCAGLTAWNAVIASGQVRQGDIVLTQGTGGVSLFALQFAKAAGAQVIITSSSDQKLEKARQLGADYTINYKTTKDWGQAALDISHGAGVDHIVELGGTQTLKQALIAIRPGGTISMIGVLSGATFGDVLLPFIVSRNVRLQGITVGNADQMASMCTMISDQKIEPVIDRKFELAETQRAFEHIKSGKHFGKVCILIK